MIQSNTTTFFDGYLTICRECKEITTGLEARLRKLNGNKCHCGGELDYIPQPSNKRGGGMIYDAPAHRGCKLSTEQKASKRRFYRPGLRMGQISMLSALKASNDALERERMATEQNAEILFLADVTDIRYLKLIHKQFHPRG